MEGHPERSSKTISGRDPFSVATVPSQGQRVLWEASFPTSCANTGSVCCIQQILSQTIQCGSCSSCRVREESCNLTSVLLRASGYSACPLGRSSSLCQTNCSSCWTSLEDLPSRRSQWCCREGGGLPAGASPTFSPSLLLALGSAKHGEVSSRLQPCTQGVRAAGLCLLSSESCFALSASEDSLKAAAFQAPCKALGPSRNSLSAFVSSVSASFY